MSKTNRRCYFFDKNGDPVDGGCPRRASICDFYHPEEDGWAAARIATHRPKKRHSTYNTRRTPTPPAYEYRARVARDSGYSPRKRRSPSRSRSLTPARRTRRDSIASTVPEEVGYSRNSRNTHPSSDSHRTSPNKLRSSTSSSSVIPLPTSPQTQQHSSTVSLPTPPVTAVEAASFGEVPFPAPARGADTKTIMPSTIPEYPRALRPSSPSRSVRPLPRTGSSATPAPPKDPLPMPPPQPLPTVPSALSAQVAPPTTVGLTVEEKRAIWEERTRILSESELAREQLAVLEEQHVFALQIVQSRYFANQPEEDKARLKGQLAELEKQRDETKKLYEESVDKLFKTGSWPVAPPSSIEDDVEEKHKEVVKYIQELKDTALQMSRILGDISMFKPPPPLFLSGDFDGENGATMDVDQPDGENPHLKRRRFSENMDWRGNGAGAAPPLMPTQEELDEFLERLAHMEGLISTLENDINEHGREAREELELLVDAKLDEFQAAREEEERQQMAEEQQQMQDLEQDITLTGDQVGELATEIGDLIMRVGKLEADVGVSRKGRQESFEKVLEVERRLQEYTLTREANVHAIQTFEKALNAYTSRPLSPPATPLIPVPSFDFIFQSLEEPMAQALRSYLVPAIEDLRKDVEDMVRAQNAELYSTLWNKITATLKVLEMIQSKMNTGDIEPEQLVGNITRRG